MPRSYPLSRLSYRGYSDGGALLLLAGLGLLFGIGRHEVHRFERKAAEGIASQLQGLDKKVQVRATLNGPLDGPLGYLHDATIRASHFSTEGLPLFTEPDRSKKGVVNELRIVLDDFRLRGLRVEHLDATIPDCRFDYSLALRKGQIRLSKSGVGTGTVRILEKDLEDFVLRKFHEIKRVKIRLERDHVFVDGFGQFLLIETEFSVIARLDAVEGTRLMLSDAKVFFDGLRADDVAKKAVLDILNPVVDLDKDLLLYGAVYVREISLRDGVLEARGDTKIPIRPKEGS